MKPILIVALAGLLGLAGCKSNSSASSSSSSSGSSSSGGWVTVAESGSVVSDFMGGATTGVSGSFDVSFSDTKNGWFVGNLGEVLKTTNGGSTVTSLNIGTSSQLRGVFARDSSYIYITGKDSTNGGASIYCSSDGGSTWTIPGNTITTYGSNRSLTSFDQFNAITFSGSSSKGMAVGRLGSIQALIWGTTTGTTWSELYLSSSATDALFSAAYISPNALAVGNSGIILATQNDGMTWTQLTSGTTKGLYKVRCFDVNTCLVVGASGTILKTTNSGTTWTAISSGTTKDLNALFVSGTKAWAGGEDEVMLYSTDSGTTWTAQTTDSSLWPVQSIFMIDDSTGFAGAANTSSNTGAILHTTSGGS